MIRLQRFMAQCGAASRRKAEEAIVGGRVRVNGKTVRELGTKVDPPRDKVELDGQRLVPQDHVWLVLHKPPGTICTTKDPEGRQTVLDLIPNLGVLLYPVGRLDYHTSGVLLLTNDGDLAQRLTHPSHGIERIYHVKVKGELTADDIEPLASGVTLDSGERVKASVSLLATTGKHTWIEMTLRQGLNRQVHRMLEAIDRQVLRLIRVQFATVRADDLPPAKHRELTQGEVNELRKLCGLAKVCQGSQSSSRPRRLRSPARSAKAPARARRNAASTPPKKRPQTARGTARKPTNSARRTGTGDTKTTKPRQSSKRQSSKRQSSKTSHRA